MLRQNPPLKDKLNNAIDGEYLGKDNSQDSFAALITFGLYGAAGRERAVDFKQRLANIEVDDVSLIAWVLKQTRKLEGTKLRLSLLKTICAHLNISDDAIAVQALQDRQGRAAVSVMYSAPTFTEDEALINSIQNLIKAKCNLNSDTQTRPVFNRSITDKDL